MTVRVVASKLPPVTLTTVDVANTGSWIRTRAAGQGARQGDGDDAAGAGLGDRQ